MSGKNPKKVKFNKEDISNLSNNKPVVYKILDKNDNNLYTGIAKRGRVHKRLEEHLPNKKDPIRGGVNVKIDQKSSISDARDSEKRIIKRSQPKHNKQGK